MSDDTDALAKRIQDFIIYVRSGHQVSDDMIIGPTVRRPEGQSGWRFIVCTESDGKVHLNSLGGDDYELTEEIKLCLMSALLRQGQERPQERPLIIHSVEDELTLVGLAEALWPSDATRKLHAAVQAERAATYH